MHGVFVQTLCLVVTAVPTTVQAGQPETGAFDTGCRDASVWAMVQDEVLLQVHSSGFWQGYHGTAIAAYFSRTGRTTIDGFRTSSRTGVNPATSC